MKKSKTCCETCAYYAYDEDWESYFCEINLDEDEIVRINSDSRYVCPYFRMGDEYTIVRKQN